MHSARPSLAPRPQAAADSECCASRSRCADGGAGREVKEAEEEEEERGRRNA